MRQVIYIPMILILIACGGSKEIVSSPEEQVNNSPSWVMDRPISSLDYIGIGKASKRGEPDEYQAIAKRNALNDMASEIEVTVTSNSLLYTLERNDMLSESFSESIITRSNLRLEGFEINDDYADDDYYWVYYRLDKSIYASVIHERKTQAIERSEQILLTARLSRDVGDISGAANGYVNVLRELQPYWGEINKTSDGQAIDRIAIDDLVSMRKGYSLGVNEDVISLDESNDFRQVLDIRSELSGELTKAVLFEYRFDKLSKEKIETDKLSLTISPGAKTQSLLSITVDPFRELRREVKREGMTFLEDILKPEITLIDIFTVYPLVSIDAKMESVSGEVSESDVMRSALIRQLAYHGIGVDDSGTSPYSIDVLVKSRDGGLAQNFQIVYSDVTIEASKNNEEILYSKRLESIKGVHKNIENAAIVSHENCADRIDQNLLKPLLDALF